MNKYKQLTRE